MSNYRTTRPLVFHLGLGRPGELRLEEGAVVQGVTLAALTGDLRSYRKAEARHRRESPGTRLAYFRAEGVVRWATALEDLIPTRDRPTVPPEATRAR